jgi:hypothetical protein
LAREVGHARENQDRISPRIKNKRESEKNQRQACGADRKFLIPRMSKFMKNNRRDLEIQREDSDSLFLWKVFWKLIKQESPFVFLLKVFLIGAFLFGMLLFILLLETYL